MKNRLTAGWAGAALVAIIATGAAMLSFSATANARESKANVQVKQGGPEITVLAPIYHRNLAIYPIRRVTMRGPNSGEKYITLDEGLKQGLIEVQEVGAANPPPLVRPRPGSNPPPANQSFQGPTNRAPAQQRVQSGGGADVNRLVVINKSDAKLILLAGEMVVGGKQDRIVQKDRIVPPNDKPTVIDVFCVEQGRWSGSTANFRNAEVNAGGFGGGGVGGGIADPAVRGAAQSKGDQGVVWQEVGRKNTQLGAPAGVTTYQAARASTTNLKAQQPYLEALESKVPGREIVGAIVAINGKLVWLDEFVSAPLFSKYWPKLLRSYVMEAVAALPPKEMEERIRWKLPTIEEAAAYLNDRAGNAKFEGEEGVYKLLRIESKEHVIYELTDIHRPDARVLHTCKMEKK